MTGEPWKENCYLVRHVPSGEQAVIDPGDEADLIVQTILEGGGPLRHVLLTHAHHDHVGAVALLCRHFDLSCEIHKGDARLLRHAPMYAWRFAGKRIESPAPFRADDHCPTILLGSGRAEVIHTPGHTSGSVCYSFGDLVFTGDTLLYEHVGRTDLPGGDAAQLVNSVDWLIKHLSDNTILLPGHGRPWNIAAARTWWNNVAKSPTKYTALEG